MDEKTVRKLEKRIEKAILEVISDMGLKRLPLLPSQLTMQLMAKAAVAVYEAAVEINDRWATCPGTDRRLIAFPQEPLPGTFNKQEIGSRTAKLILSNIFAVFRVDFRCLFLIHRFIEAGIEWLGLTSHLQVLR